MKTGENHNQTTNRQQANIRFADLRRWMYMNNVTFVAIGRACGVSMAAMQKSLGNERMPVRHHAAITAAWPDMPLELLPVPMDIPSGPRPRNLPDLLSRQSSTST